MTRLLTTTTGHVRRPLPELQALRRLLQEVGPPAPRGHHVQRHRVPDAGPGHDVQGRRGPDGLQAGDRARLLVRDRALQAGRQFNRHLALIAT